MTTSSFIAIVALAISFVGGVIQFVKWLQELRDRRQLAKETSIKSAAESQLSAIKASEGALLMMQEVLELTRAESRRKDERIRELELRVFELERRLALYEKGDKDG